jgi:hypothetical protein
MGQDALGSHDITNPSDGGALQKAGRGGKSSASSSKGTLQSDVSGLTVSIWWRRVGAVALVNSPLRPKLSRHLRQDGRQLSHGGGRTRPPGGTPRLGPRPRRHSLPSGLFTGARACRKARPPCYTAKDRLAALQRMQQPTNSALRNWLLVGITGALAAPAPIVRLSGVELTSGADVAISGVAILSAAFLLTWTSEAAERDVSRGLALALIALIAVLRSMPWTPSPGRHACRNAPATANMTGANCLWWALPAHLVLIFWLRTKTTLSVRGDTSPGLVALGAATLTAFPSPSAATCLCWTRRCS